MITSKQSNFKRDTQILFFSSFLCVSGLLGVLLFSSLAIQFTDEEVSRGADEEDEVMEHVIMGDYRGALQVVDTLIANKQEKVPRLPYLDRFLAEEERLDVANARADLYELQWKRIGILKEMGNRALLVEALNDYCTVIGYNQDKAKAMLDSLENE